ncbi:MAG: carboxymuconolactone decarboxylase family protein [Candidatus Lambdaproteobacteria bacterium]|nr:carboxymuconolactone decarboxylase family protein [Candidatus Lambdaproteobacteria bacterium]
MAVDYYKLGMKMREEVIGNPGDADAPELPEFEREFRRFITETAWGRVWGDSALTKQQHSLNCLCILAALNRTGEFEAHVRGAIKNGVTKEQLKATFMQIAGYAGVPAGVGAFRAARKVFKELGI